MQEKGRGGDEGIKEVQGSENGGDESGESEREGRRYRGVKVEGMRVGRVREREGGTGE